MMDMLKLKLASKFMKGFVAKMISKQIYEKLGCNIGIKFNDIEVDTIDGDVIVHIDAKGTLTRAEFEKLMDNFD